MAELGLFPEPQMVIAQGFVYICSLLSTNYFIIQPALRLSRERKRRTSGAVNLAKAEELRSENLEAHYTAQLKARTEEVKSLRVLEVLAGQAEAESILSHAQEKSRIHLSHIQSQVQNACVMERQKIPVAATQMVDTILSQFVGQIGTITLGLTLSFVSFQAFASGGGNVEFWTGIFWPYFQFFCFILAVCFFGKKAMQTALETRRGQFRTKLSEAKQAVTLAHRKTEEFEKKVASLQSEIDQLREQYVTDGVRERAQLIADAQLVASQMILDSERAAHELVLRSKADLRQELIESTIHMLEARLTPDKVNILNQRLKSEAVECLLKSQIQ